MYSISSYTFYLLQTNNVRVQLVAVFWIREFLELGGAGSMIAHSAGILKAVLLSVDEKAAEQRRECRLD